MGPAPRRTGTRAELSEGGALTEADGAGSEARAVSAVGSSALAAGETSTEALARAAGRLDPGAASTAAVGAFER